MDPKYLKQRKDVRIALVCAMSSEAEMVELIMKKWPKEMVTLGKAPTDNNTYTLGVIGRHNVVLVYMPGTGTVNGAHVAANLRSSFQNIVVCIVIGICGAVPKNSKTEEEIVLGDCIVSGSVVIQGDHGRKYEAGFVRKTGVEDSLGRAGPAIRSFNTALQTRTTKEALESRLAKNLEDIQRQHPAATYPGVEKDWLFPSDYPHKHHSMGMECEQCIPAVETCRKNCSELDCEQENLIKRTRLANTDEPPSPKLHFGVFSSSNHVLRSGQERDQIAAREGVIAFEMEAPGFWDILPTMVVKSACDYADCHKNKDWQTYAAATAAAGVAAILDEWESPDLPGEADATRADLPRPSGTSKVKRVRNVVNYVRGDQTYIESITGNPTFNSYKS